MELRMLEVGRVGAAAGMWRRGDEMDRELEIPVPAYLVETDEERILVDTGLHPDAVGEPRGRYLGSELLGLFSLRQEATIAEQLDVESLTMVVLTHLHFDHVGGLALLPDSLPVILQRREWEAARDPAAVARNFFLPAEYADLDGRLRLVDGDHDLLGDGSVELLLTPGHTPGHQSVRVGDVVIGGDVAHFSSTLDDRRFPAFGDDPAAQDGSAERLRGLREAGLTVRPGHDPELLAPGPVALS